LAIIKSAAAAIDEASKRYLRDYDKIDSRLLIAEVRQENITNRSTAQSGHLMRPGA